MVYMIMNILVLLGKLEATYDYSTFYNKNNKTPINIQPFSRSQTGLFLAHKEDLNFLCPENAFYLSMSGLKMIRKTITIFIV